MQESQKFEGWGVVELFGHQMIAGKISEATIGGCSFVRVDVPVPITDTAGGADQWAYTRYFGQGAIYALNPTSELVARNRAEHCQAPPFAYDVNQEILSKGIDAGVERRMKAIGIQKDSTSSAAQQADDDYDIDEMEDEAPL